MISCGVSTKNNFPSRGLEEEEHIKHNKSTLQQGVSFSSFSLGGGGGRLKRNYIVYSNEYLPTNT